jgi:hypothetical protein
LDYTHASVGFGNAADYFSNCSGQGEQVIFPTPVSTTWEDGLHNDFPAYMVYTEKDNQKNILLSQLLAHKNITNINATAKYLLDTIYGLINAA